VVVGVQVGNVNGPQVAEDVERRLAAKLSVYLKQSSLAAVEQDEVVPRRLDKDGADAAVLTWDTRARP